MRHRAFTFVDLCIVLVMGSILIGVMLPSVACRARESANRIKCSSNLRQIGLAFKLYANEDGTTYSFPRTTYEKGKPPVVYTGADSASPFSGATRPEANDVTAAAFLLLRTQDLTTDVFICPASNADRFRMASGKSVQDYSNFHDQNELSYSFHNPYFDAAAIEAGATWNDNLEADFAMAGDMNSGTSALLTTQPDAGGQRIRELNSPNHDYDGQNVLYADGHVDWNTGPFVGTQSDNIYTYGPSPSSAYPGVTSTVGFYGSQINARDSVLLPTWDANTPLPSVSPMPTGPWVVVLAVVVLGTLMLAALVFLIVHLLRNRRRGPPPMPQ